MAESCFVHVTTNLLREGYSVRFRAKGTSMSPTIDDGERVIVEPVAPSAVTVGDVVLYRSHRGVIAHRVVAIEHDRDEGSGVRNSQSSILNPQFSRFSDCFILKGDASDACDAPVEAAQVLGRVTCVERSGCSIGLESRPATLLHALRLSTARLRRAISRRLPRVAYLLRTCRDLFRVALKANA